MYNKRGSVDQLKHLSTSHSASPAVQAALEAGKCVVIGLQSTGEARTLDVVAERAVDGELDDFVSGPKVSLYLCVVASTLTLVQHSIVVWQYAPAFICGVQLANPRCCYENLIGSLCSVCRSCC